MSNNTDLLFDELPDEWEHTTLGDVCRRGGGFIQTGPFGSQLHAGDYVPVGIPTVMPANIGNNQIITDNIARITQRDAERLSRHRLEVGDVVFGRRGDVGRRALVRSEQAGWLCGTGSLRIHFGRGIVDPLFASYYLGHPAVRDWIVRHAVGSTMPNLNTTIMSAVPFALPPFAEQRAIARILGSLDDKIELNRRLNRTLEALAAAIFKSWFVDFDPVVARAEGRQPFGMDAATAALFPDAFEETEVGPVPVGWRVGSILEVADLLSGGTPSTSIASYWDGDVPWVSAKDVSNANGLFVLETERTITPEGLEHSVAKLLPKSTTVVTARGTVGSYCLLGREMAMNQTNYGLRAKDGVGDYFVFFGLAQMVEQLKQHAYGTIFDTITTRTFRDVKVVLPHRAVIERFEWQVSPLMELALANLQQSRTLAAIRDSLLPKLMSGEIRVG